MLQLAHPGLRGCDIVKHKLHPFHSHIVHEVAAICKVKKKIRLVYTDVRRAVHSISFLHTFATTHNKYFSSFLKFPHDHFN